MTLDLPEPDPTQLARAPLELVVCQIRFEPLPTPRESAMVRKFHEALGGGDGPYPRIDPVNSLTVSIAPVQLPPQATSGWRFTAPDDSWAVSLMADSVAIETRKYETWDGADAFRDRLEKVVDTAAALLEPTFEQRVGLRYVDRIGEFKLAAPSDWEPYISPHLLGLAIHPKLGRCVEGSVQQLTLRLDEGVACGLRHGFLPDDATGVTMDYLLDFDLYRQGVRPFDAAEVKSFASDLNRYALQLFQACVTTKLRDELRGEAPAS